jgi:chromosome transmission fidelity protein 1
MAPLSDFRSQLFPYLPEDKLSFFSCGHVMPAENLKALVVSRGPAGNPLLFKHQQQKDPLVVCDGTNPVNSPLKTSLLR